MPTVYTYYLVAETGQTYTGDLPAPPAGGGQLTGVYRTAPNPSASTTSLPTVGTAATQNVYAEVNLGTAPDASGTGTSGVYEGTADPTVTPPADWAGGGGGLYIRNNAGVTELWVSTGSLPTAWTKITVP